VVEGLELVELLFFDDVPDELLLCASATAPTNKSVPKTVVFIP